VKDLLNSKLDKTAFSVVSLEETDECDDAYWFSRTPEERLEYMGWLRQINHGLDATSARLQRVLTVAHDEELV